MENNLKQQLREVFDEYEIVKSTKINLLIDTFIDFNFNDSFNNLVLNSYKSNDEEIFILIESKDYNIIYTYMFKIHENLINSNIKTINEYVLLGKMPSKLFRIGEK